LAILANLALFWPFLAKNRSNGQFWPIAQFWPILANFWPIFWPFFPGQKNRPKNGQFLPLSGHKQMKNDIGFT